MMTTNYRKALVLAVATAALLSGCASGPGAEFITGARNMAPARYDTDGSRMAAARAFCLQREDGKTADQISASAVETIKWVTESDLTTDRRTLDAGEAKRFVEYSLRHCDYLLGPDAERRIDEATLEMLRDNRDRNIERAERMSIPRGDAEEIINEQIAELERKLGE